jgi:hypothetical protein
MWNYLSALMLLPVAVFGNLCWEMFPNILEVREIIGNHKIECPTGVKSMLYFSDSFLRVVTSLPFSNLLKIFNLSLKIHFRLFIIRLLGCLANVMQCLGMVLCGGDIFAVMRQARIPLVAVLRYIWLDDHPTIEEIIYLWIILLSSISFVLAKEKGEDNFGAGILLLVAALLLRSFYYVLTEVYLKRNLKSLSLMEKQSLVGVHDMIGYFIVTWIEIYIERRSYNPLKGFFSNCGCTVSSIANFLQNWLCISIMFSFDSMILQLLQTVATGLTWVTKCTYNSKEFILIKIPILLTIITVVAAYIWLKNKRQ